MTIVAVLGNSSLNAGAACAADLALAGHSIRYAPFDPAPAELEALRVQKGFDVQGDPAGYFSGRTGRAVLDGIFDTATEALAGAEVVLLDVPMQDLESRFAAILPDLPRQAVVHVLSHGYWPAARLAPLLRRSGREDVLVTEAVGPMHATALNGTVLKATRRRRLEIATVPNCRIDAALTRLQPLFSDLSAAPTALQTGLEGLNLMVHPAMVLLGIGLFERADLRGGESVRFYRECNVPSADRLADALDAERQQVCAAYGVRCQSLPAAIDRYYGTTGEGIYESILNCAVYQSFGAYSVSTVRGWAATDVAYAIVPLVRLADQAGVGAPLHRAIAEIFGVVLGISPWSSTPTLEDMALEGDPETVVRRFAEG